MRLLYSALQTLDTVIHVIENYEHLIKLRLFHLQITVLSKIRSNIIFTQIYDIYDTVVQYVTTGISTKQSTNIRHGCACNFFWVVETFRLNVSVGAIYVSVITYCKLQKRHLCASSILRDVKKHYITMHNYD